MVLVTTILDFYPLQRMVVPVKSTPAIVVSAMGEQRFPNTVLLNAAAIVLMYTSSSLVRCTITGTIRGNIIPANVRVSLQGLSLLSVEYYVFNLVNQIEKYSRALLIKT